MSVSIVIPIYPHGPGIAAMAAETLRLFREHTPGAEIVVTHNGGPDSDRELLEGLADRYIRLSPNQGYSPAVNAGVEAATGDVIVVGSDDAQVEPGWLHPILDALEDLDIASPSHSGDAGVGHKHVEFCGVLFALRRATWDRFGPLDTDVFRVRKGDQDFAVRARIGGARLGIVPASQFRHVAAHHSKAAIPQATLDGETAAFRERYGAATYGRWRRLQP